MLEYGRSAVFSGGLSLQTERWWAEAENGPGF